MQQRIFITGASSGIGLLTARALCAQGHEVWGTSRTLGKLPGMERFHPVVLDLNEQSSIEAGFRQALLEAGHFDVLINNAGAGVFGPLEGFSNREFTAQLQTLLVGPLQLIRLALPAMRARRAGLIVNVSSLAGELPLPFMSPYSLSKAALSAMSEGLNLELAHTGVRLVDVRPSDFATEFHGFDPAAGPRARRGLCAESGARLEGDPSQHEPRARSAEGGRHAGQDRRGQDPPARGRGGRYLPGRHRPLPQPARTARVGAVGHSAVLRVESESAAG